MIFKYPYNHRIALSHGVWLMMQDSYDCTTAPNKIISRYPSMCPFSSWWLLFTLDLHSSCPYETNLNLFILAFTIFTAYSMTFCDFYLIISCQLIHSCYCYLWVSLCVFFVVVCLFLLLLFWFCPFSSHLTSHNTLHRLSCSW